MKIDANKVLNNVLSAIENAESYLKYARVNKQTTQIEYWTKQLEIFKMLLK